VPVVATSGLDPYGNALTGSVPAGSVVVILGDSIQAGGGGGTLPGQVLSGLPAFANIPIYVYAFSGTTAGPIATVDSGLYLLAASAPSYIEFENGAQVATGTATVSSMLTSYTGSGYGYFIAAYGANDVKGANGQTLAAYETDMSSIWTTAHGYGARVEVINLTITDNAAVPKSTVALWNSWLRGQMNSLVGPAAAYADYLADENAFFSNLTVGTNTGDIWSADGLHPSLIGEKMNAFIIADSVLRNVTYPQFLGMGPGAAILSYPQSSTGAVGYLYMIGGTTTGNSGQINLNAGSSGSGGNLFMEANGAYSGGSLYTYAGSAGNGGGINLVGGSSGGNAGSISLAAGGSGSGGSILCEANGSANGGGILMQAQTSAGGVIKGYGGNGASAPGGNVWFYGDSAAGGNLYLEANGTVSGGTLTLSNGVNSIITSGATPYTLTLPATQNDTFATLGASQAFTGVDTFSGINLALIPSGSSTSMAVGKTYQPTGSSSEAFLLPTTAAVGQTVDIIGTGTGGWTVTQNAGQQVRFAGATTTSGTGGYVASANQDSCVTLTCTVANTTWTVTNYMGAITLH
jgi:hypothetical protein